MAKKRSTAHLAPYQFRSAAPVVINRTRTIVKKPKHRRRSGGGGGMGLGTIFAAELALQVAEPIVMGLVSRVGVASTLPQPVVIAAVAHFAKADKYVKGVQLLTKIKAIESMLGGGMGTMFAPPAHG